MSISEQYAQTVRRNIWNIRTDLAVEQIQPDDIGSPRVCTVRSRGRAFGITEIVISDDSCRETLGKGKGRYITLESGDLSRFSDDYEDMAQELAEELAVSFPTGRCSWSGLETGI